MKKHDVKNTYLRIGMTTDIRISIKDQYDVGRKVTEVKLCRRVAAL